MSRKHYSLWHEARSTPSLALLVRELRRALKGCNSVLDVGCGSRSPLRLVRASHTTGIDGYQPALDEARSGGTHDDFAFGDVKDIGKVFVDRRFDACIALDVIEHLTKEDGWKMLETMERLATKRVVIFTPNGFIPQKSHDGDLQEHLSGWLADEMRQRGYCVRGMYGLKSLRGEYHHIKRSPKAFWLMVAILSHYLYTHHRPEKSSAIFCVKELDKDKQSA